jgi:hypothetical protein
MAVPVSGNFESPINIREKFLKGNDVAKSRALYKRQRIPNGDQGIGRRLTESWLRGEDKKIAIV